MDLETNIINEPIPEMSINQLKALTPTNLQNLLICPNGAEVAQRGIHAEYNSGDHCILTAANKSAIGLAWLIDRIPEVASASKSTSTNMYIPGADHRNGLLSSIF